MLTTFFVIAMLLHLAFGLAIGYFILYSATRLDNGLRTLGLILGWFIIVLSIVFMIYSVVIGVNCRNNPKKYCPMHYMMMKRSYSQDSDDKAEPCEPCQRQMIQNVSPTVNESQTPQQPQSSDNQAEKIFNPTGTGTGDSQNTKNRANSLTTKQTKTPAVNGNQNVNQTMPEQNEEQ